MSCNEPLIRSSFECLQHELGRLARRWRPRAPVYTIRAVARAAEDFMVAMLDDVKLARFDELDAAAVVQVHDAYLRVLALAGLLDEARDGEWADMVDIECGYESAIDVLDALAPCVSHADRALRRVALEDVDVEAACRWIEAQARADAAVGAT